MTNLKYKYWLFRLFQLSLVAYPLLLIGQSLPLLLFFKQGEGIVVNRNIDIEKWQDRYGRSREIKFRTPVIAYPVDGRIYTINGGYDEEDTRIGSTVKVLYAPYYPAYGKELSFWGLINGRLLSTTYQGFVYLSVLLFAFSGYDIFKFSIPTLSTKAFEIIVVLLLAIPLILWVPFLMHAKVVKGVATYVDPKISHTPHKTLVGTFNGKPISAVSALGSSYYRENEPCQILVNSRHPEEAYELSFFTFYPEGIAVAIAVLSFYLFGWHFATRKDEETEAT